MRTKCIAAFFALHIALAAQAPPHLPPYPSDFLEKLTYFEEQSEFNTFSYSPGTPLSIMDKGKLIRSSFKDLVSKFLLKDGHCITFIEHQSNTLQQSYFSKIKTTVIDSNYIAHYDALGSLIQQIPNAGSSGTTMQESLLQTLYPISEELKWEIESQGGKVEELKDKVWLITTQEMKETIDLERNFTFNRSLNGNSCIAWQKTEFEKIQSESFYPNYQLNWTPLKMSNGSLCDHYSEIKRTAFTFVQHRETINKPSERISAVNSARFEIKPNPSTSEIFISGPEKIVELYIWNLNYAMIRKVNTIPNNRLNISDLPSGIYFIEMMTKAGNSISKLIKL